MMVVINKSKLKTNIKVNNTLYKRCLLTRTKARYKKWVIPYKISLFMIQIEPNR